MSYANLRATLPGGADLFYHGAECAGEQIVAAIETELEKSE